MRKHSDLDICIFEEDKESFIKFMHNKGWLIYEPLANGLKRLITNPSEQKVEQICVFCIKPDCSFIKMHLIGYQKDFDMTVPFLCEESKNWLIHAIEMVYPNWHEWIEL